MPIKQLIRLINQVYAEKMMASKEAASIRTQSLSAFFYDSYINRYGLLNVAERKIKEIFLSAAFNRTKLLKIELFSRFLGISEQKYSSDDMHFMFSIAVLLLQK